MRRFVAVMLAFLCMAGYVHGKDKVNKGWQQAMLAAIDSFPERGGYYTGGKPNELFTKTTWQGLHDAYRMTASDERPQFLLKVIWA